MDGIEEKSKPDFLKWGMVALLVIAGLIIIGGGIFVYRKAIGGKKTVEVPQIKEETAVSTPTPELAQSPEASPTPKLKRKDLVIKILNGTGVPGTAAKAVDYLEKLGYSGIKTGNADNFDYQKTVVQIKDSKKDYLEQLRADLSANYTLEEKTQTLTEDDKFEAIIILGKE